MISEFIVSSRNDREIPRNGGSVALMAGYSINVRFAIEAGVGYTLHGWADNYEGVTFIAIDPVNSIDPAIPMTYAVRQEFHYLDIPLRGTMSFGKGRWRSISSVGVSANLLMRATFVSIFNGERSSTEHDYYEKFNFTAFASTGIAFLPNDRNEFRLEPTFRYALLPIIDAPITGYLWSVGLNIGYYRRF